MATNPNPLSLLAVLLDFILQNLYNKTMIKLDVAINGEVR